jgi:hypothetical protein
MDQERYAHGPAAVLAGEFRHVWGCRICQGLYRRCRGVEAAGINSEFVADCLSQRFRKHDDGLNLNGITNDNGATCTHQGPYRCLRESLTGFVNQKPTEGLWR